MNNHETQNLNWQHEKEQADKRLLNIEIVLGLITTLSFFAILFLAAYLIFEQKIYVLPITIIVLDFVMFIVGSSFCQYIEQKAGYYQCGKCHKKFIPTFKQALWSPHMLRTKYLRCPHCKHWSWNKKVIK